MTKNGGATLNVVTGAIVFLGLVFAEYIFDSVPDIFPLGMAVSMAFALSALLVLSFIPRLSALRRYTTFFGVICLVTAACFGLLTFIAQGLSCC